MATPFSDVYNHFLSNITDYSLAELDDVSLDSNMKTWLLNAIVNYPNSKNDITDYNEALAQFNVDLSHAEKVILGKLMTIEYITPFIVDETLLKEKLNSKDYRSFSTANHLKTLQDLKNLLHNEVSLMISRSSYSVKNLEEWFGKKK
ncbi:hypothetical protein D7X33_20970 [Butyricicoccus sp. 1XD8-22]|nr:hypothetical protein D7X33_20970 [Butyricicoccus sp. 1XD8-22]